MAYALRPTLRLALHPQQCTLYARCGSRPRPLVEALSSMTDGELFQAKGAGDPEGQRPETQHMPSNDKNMSGVSPNCKSTCNRLKVLLCDAPLANTLGQLVTTMFACGWNKMSNN